MLYFSLKDKCSEPVKVVPEGSRTKKAESKFKDTSTDTAIVEIPMPTKKLIDKMMSISGSGFTTQGTNEIPVSEMSISGSGFTTQGTSEIPVTEMEKMSIVGQRTEKKRKYNKSKLNLPSNNFNA